VRNAGHDSTVTAAQAEAALNSKNVEEVVQEAVDDAYATSSWVPDQETGVFVPAEGAASAASVMDQTVFNREEEMEDVERPAVDMANGDNDAK
jgi:peroxiredoxin